jgi:transposase
MRTERFCADTFLAFLKELLSYQRRGGKMVVILDNERWHHAKAIKPWLRDHQHVLRLGFLPPYSPELNPIERVWELTRRVRTHNRYFPHLDELVDSVVDQFALWQRPNQTLRGLCAVISDALYTTLYAFCGLRSNSIKSAQLFFGGATTAFGQ